MYSDTTHRVFPQVASMFEVEKCQVLHLEEKAWANELRASIGMFLLAVTRYHHFVLLYYLVVLFLLLASVVVVVLLLVLSVLWWWWGDFALPK